MSNTPRPKPSFAYDGQHVDDVAARLDLVNRFNQLVGTPDAAVGKLQRDFVTGHMTNSDMEEFIRLYEYLIDAIENAKRP